MSYEASAALFTLSKHPPAVKGCLAQYPFWQAPVPQALLLMQGLSHVTMSVIVLLYWSCPCSVYALGRHVI